MSFQITACEAMQNHASTSAAQCMRGQPGRAGCTQKFKHHNRGTEVPQTKEGS